MSNYGLNIARLPKTRITISQGGSNGSRASPNMKNLLFQCGETYISPIIIPITANIYIYTRKYTPLEYLQLFHAFSPIPPPFISPFYHHPHLDEGPRSSVLLRRPAVCVAPRLPLHTSPGRSCSGPAIQRCWGRRPSARSSQWCPHSEWSPDDNKKAPPKKMDRCPEFQLFSLCCLHDIYFIFADCQDKS